MKTQVIFIAIFLIFLSGCSTLDKVSNRITKKFEYEPLKDLKISGIYRQEPTNNGQVQFYVFYEDGTVVCNLTNKWIDSINIQDYLTNIEIDTLELYKFSIRYSWGYYYSSDNHLVIKNIDSKRFPLDVYTAYISRYEWIKEKKLKRISSEEIQKNMIKDIAYEEYLEKNSSIKYHELIFVDTCNCLESDTWLKYEKWFWKNEQDYLNWIERNGGNKRKYHY